MPHSKLHGAIAGHSRWTHKTLWHTRRACTQHSRTRVGTTARRGSPQESRWWPLVIKGPQAGVWLGSCWLQTEPPLLSPKPGMVCFLRDFGQLVGQSHLSPPHSRLHSSRVLTSRGCAMSYSKAYSLSTSPSLHRPPQVWRFEAWF